MTTSPSNQPTPSSTISPTPKVTREPVSLSFSGPLYFVAPGGDDDGPGSRESPWATVNHAAQKLRSGETVIIRGGRYVLSEQIRPRNSGEQGSWITYSGYPGEEVILDAEAISNFAPADRAPYPHDNGAFQIEGVSYVRVQNIGIERSHAAGITVRDSSHIELINNHTNQTFSSGIAVWDTNHDGVGTEDIRVLGNTITHATTWEMLPAGMKREGEPPHEAISIAGAVGFEVAFNHVYDSDKEGIDVKETSRNGKVHHNLVHDVARQGLYVDAWFGEIEDIEFTDNIVYRCRGAGVIVSVENGKQVRNVRIHHNLIFNNLGSGIFFSRWGDGPRSDIRIYNNTIVHNGHGQPAGGERFFWLTGGLYFYSTNLRDIEVRENIFSDNRGFQIGYSELYLAEGLPVEAVMRGKGIAVTRNLVDDRNDVEYPIRAGWPPDDYAMIYAFDGEAVVNGDPMFIDPKNQDFRLKPGSPATGLGMYPDASPADFWWKENFPPSMLVLGN